MYLNALWTDKRERRRASGYALEVTYLTKQGSGGSDTKSSPNTPDQTTDDGQNFMAKELRDKLSETQVGAG